MSEQLLPGYCIRAGSRLDRALLVKFMQMTYQELFPSRDFSHLAATVEQYFSKETPLWWVDLVSGGTRGQGDKGTRGQAEQARNTNYQLPTTNYPFIIHPSSFPVACLWAGNAVDQVRGDRYTHIFLLYVKPAHRRRGIGTALMQYVENWASARGDHQIGLQVFQSNTAAQHLYNQLGYQTGSLWMLKQLDEEE